MKRSLLLSPLAETDIFDAYRWYEDRLKGLGRQFLKELDLSFRSIVSYPSQSAKVHGEIRRLLTRRFPYAVFFIFEEDAVIILAVLHQARDPKRWKERN